MKKYVKCNVSDSEIQNMIDSIATYDDFNEFESYLVSLNLDNDTEYKWYNKAFVKFFGREPFDENGNFIKSSCSCDKKFMKKYVKASTDQSVRSGIIDAIDRASNTDPNVGATTWYELAETSDKIWAFVCAWLDLDGDGEYRLMGKIAYMPTRSAMSDYDYDWMMPEMPNGDIVDTELEIDPNGDIDYDVDWWVDSWDRIKSKYVYDDIEESTKIRGRRSITSASSGLRKMTQKQIKDYVRDGAAIDITNYGFDEMDQFLREHNLDKIAISRGVYGMNGGLLQDRNTGELYAITARNSALMMAF